MENYLQPQSCLTIQISDEASRNTNVMAFTGLPTFKLLVALQYN